MYCHWNVWVIPQRREYSTSSFGNISSLFSITFYRLPLVLSYPTLQISVLCWTCFFHVEKVPLPQDPKEMGIKKNWRCLRCLRGNSIFVFTLLFCFKCLYSILLYVSNLSWDRGREEGREREGRGIKGLSAPSSGPLHQWLVAHCSAQYITDTKQTWKESSVVCEQTGDIEGKWVANL